MPAGLALALVVTGPVVAEAKQTTDRNGNTSTVARTTDGRAITNEKIANEVTEYWTAERMAGAVDLDFVKPKGATEATSRVPESTGTAGSVAPVRASIATSDDASIQLNESPPVGKVYFTDPAGNQYSCSASTVASGKRRGVTSLFFPGVYAVPSPLLRSEGDTQSRSDEQEAAEGPSRRKPITSRASFGGPGPPTPAYVATTSPRRCLQKDLGVG